MCALVELDVFPLYTRLYLVEIKSGFRIRKLVRGFLKFFFSIPNV